MNLAVSVIITTCNRPIGLENAVMSVLNQTYPPIEIIIIDDASKKEQPPIERTNIPIRYFRNRHQRGACYSRNRGAKLATGSVLMFLDDDDTWEPNKIESQIRVFQENPDVGLVYSGRLIVFDRNREKISYVINPKHQGVLFPDILYNNLIGTTSSVALKKGVFVEAGGFDVDLPAMQDYDLWIRCCRITKVAHDSQCNVRYTVSTDPNKQISGNAKHEVAAKQILEKYREEIKSQGFLRKRKIYSERFFYVAKALRRQTYGRAVWWSFWSILYYPNVKAISLLFPKKIIYFFQKCRKQKP